VVHPVRPLHERASTEILYYSCLLTVLYFPYFSLVHVYRRGDRTRLFLSHELKETRLIGAPGVRLSFTSLYSLRQLCTIPSCPCCMYVHAYVFYIIHTQLKTPLSPCVPPYRSRGSTWVSKIHAKLIRKQKKKKPARSYPASSPPRQRKI